MDTKKLRQKILDLAIRGKLVPQDPNDEPASVLLERIKAEKERLIKEGKIKRNKKENTSDKSPYQNLPENWAICKLTDIASFGGGKTPSTANRDFWNKASHLWVTSKDMKHYIIEDSLVKISDIGTAGMQIFPPLTILMVVRSGILRRTLPIAILKKKATINQDLKAICVYETSIVDFIFWSLKANEQSILDIYQKDGTTVESINFEKFQEITISLPPLEEQQRIISAIESAFALIDEIETNKLSLEQFIKQAKFKVLDLAIHGKLVPQDPNDELASALLERIKKEQKTSKVASDISHYPFEIPESWVWCKLGDIGSWSAGTTPSRTNKEYYANASIPWLKTGDLNDGIIDDVSEYISEYALRGCKQLKLNPVGSIAIALYGATIGKCGILALETTTNQACCVCKTHPIVFNKYLFFFLLSHREQFKDKAEGGAQPNISKDKIVKSFIPIPPLKEQKRIVQKIETIFQTLDTISNNL